MTGFKQALIFIGVIALIITSGFFYNKQEIFTILTDSGESGKINLGNLTAKECQDKCQNETNCKYIQRPDINLWEKGPCYIYNDPYQFKVGKSHKKLGGESDGMSTWKNKNYLSIAPAEYVLTSSDEFSTRQGAKEFCETKKSDAGELSLCHSDQIREYKDGNQNLCKNGWTTDKKGFWVGQCVAGRTCGANNCHNSQYWYNEAPDKTSAHCCSGMTK